MKKYKIIILSSILIQLLCQNLNAQAPSIQWQKTFGGTLDDEGHSVCLTSGNGFAILGYTKSTDGNITDHHILSPSGDNFLLIKIDSIGNLNWNKCYGGTGIDVGYSIIQTIDGGFILTGSSSSNDYDVIGLHGGSFGSRDFWLVKTDNNGILQWQKCLGGTDYDEAYNII